MQAVEEDQIDILAVQAPACKVLSPSLLDLLASARTSVLVYHPPGGGGQQQLLLRQAQEEQEQLMQRQEQGQQERWQREQWRQGGRASLDRRQGDQL